MVEIHYTKSHSTLRAKRAKFFILSRQKSTKMSKIGHFPEAWRQTVLPDRSVLIGEKIESFQSKRASFI